jgi:DMSO reductase anchor subunit
MHPAASIIFFTTASGLGYGLAAMLGLGLLDPATVSAKLANVMALGLISAGLLSSTLHLRNPQRAWRAFSQWRTSWLSREGVLAVATFVPLAINAFATVFLSRHSVMAGLGGALGAVATVYCTSMIYASLRSVDAWNTWLTSACYLLFAAAGGALLVAVFAWTAGQGTRPLAGLALLLVAGAWLTKMSWRHRLKTLRPLSTPESATGLGHIGRVRLFEAPHVNDNYLTSEMGFRVARKHAEKLFVIAVALGGGVPVVVLAIVVAGDLTDGLWPSLALGLALLSHAAGIVVERWLFFAEARHAVMTYYGR